VIDALELLGFVGLLFLAGWGWGSGVVGLLRRAGWETVRSEIGIPLQVLLGTALFMVFGGFMVAADAARLGPLLAWQVVGLVLLSIYGLRSRRRWNVTVASLVNAVAVLCAGVVLTLVALGVAANAPFNLNDDDAAYIYLARRLASTGGLVDPFNLRRVTGYGGGTLFQSMFYRIPGDTSLHGFELIFGSLLLVLLAVGTTRRKWLAVGTLLLGIGIMLGNDVGVVINLSPTFTIAAFSLGTLQVLRLVRWPSEADQPLVYVVVGVLLSGILALRFSFMVSMSAAALIVIVVLRGRRAVRSAVIVGLTVGICSAGWALALYRSSRSLLFPLFPGNYDPSWPTGQNEAEFAHGVRSFSRFSWDVFTGSHLGWVALAGVGIGVYFYIVSGGRSKGMLVLLSAGIGCLVQFAAYAYSLSGSTAVEVVRLLAPSTLACGLFAIGLLWPQRDSVPDDPAEVMASSTPIDRLGRSMLRVTKGLVGRGALANTTALVAIVGLATLVFAYNPIAYVRGTHGELTASWRMLHQPADQSGRYRPLEPEYDRMNEMIPKGAKVLAAVDFPGLLDFSRYDFATLDIVGAVSPPPHMPYFEGAMAKVDYLRRLGYQYIVTESPSDQGLYDLQTWLGDYKSEVVAYRRWVPYFVDWQSSMATLERSNRFEVRSSSSLVLIRIA
jgi:hypothetical protein